MDRKPNFICITKICTHLPFALEALGHDEDLNETLRTLTLTLKLQKVCIVK